MLSSHKLDWQQALCSASGQLLIFNTKYIQIYFKYNEIKQIFYYIHTTPFYPIPFYNNTTQFYQIIYIFYNNNEWAYPILLHERNYTILSHFKIDLYQPILLVSSKTILLQNIFIISYFFLL